MEHHIFRFAKMSLRDRCSTSYDLASLVRDRRNTLDGMENGKTHWCAGVSSALNFPFLEEVLQDCLVFDVVTLSKICGSLAELLSL